MVMLARVLWLVVPPSERMETSVPAVGRVPVMVMPVMVMLARVVLGLPA